VAANGVKEKNTVHNLVQTLSVKLDSAARYGLYKDDASMDGLEDCAEVFDRLAARERESIEELLSCLRDHIDDAQLGSS
jgi:rubrerythrin